MHWPQQLCAAAAMLTGGGLEHSSFCVFILLLKKHHVRTDEVTVLVINRMFFNTESRDRASFQHLMYNSFNAFWESDIMYVEGVLI
jgi:hypothetical protein